MPSWGELKAAYRFFSQPKIAPEDVLQPHWERTQVVCREPGEYLLIEDTTQLDYTAHAAAEGLGIIGKAGGGRGICLHTTLALRVSAWDLEQQPETTVVGLFGQQGWSQKRRPQGETRAQRVWRSNRSSKRWAEVFQSSASPSADSQWVYIADREADFYEPIQRCRQRGVDFVIRACQNRRLASEATHLSESWNKRMCWGRRRWRCAAAVDRTRGEPRSKCAAGKWI
jgi:hypothetical protein